MHRNFNINMSGSPSKFSTDLVKRSPRFFILWKTILASLTYVMPPPPYLILLLYMLWYRNLVVDMDLLISCKHSVPMVVIAVYPRTCMEILTANLLIEYRNIIIQVFCSYAEIWSISLPIFRKALYEQLVYSSTNFNIP